MRLDMSQQMKMDQRMMLAPRMIQSMEILQLPLMALQERIEQEMLTNPVLELEEQLSDLESADTNDLQNPAETELPDMERSLDIKDDNNRQEDFERLDGISESDGFNDYLSRSSYIRSSGGSQDRDRKFEAMQNTAAPAKSLNEYLHEQWAFVDADPVVKQIGSVMIDFIEPTGYLLADMDKIREHVKVNVTNHQLKEALRLVQTLDPVGVGARNLGECLVLQIEHHYQDFPDKELAIELATTYLKDIEMNRYPLVARKTGRSIAEIKETMRKIVRLDPQPGMQIGNHSVQYIVPDIIVEYDEENDTYTAKLTEGGMPSLRINTLYNDMLKDRKVATDARKFLQENIRSARWLIDSINQRKATLMRVVNYVLSHQRDFLDKGPVYLKPLPMVDVAQALGIHVGTVSRAVSGKYVQTPTGIFPLRSFFSGGTETYSGQSVSFDAVRAKLREIVDNEDKKHPFNDDQLAAEMQKRGFKLARRTVAKYRNILNIPPARQRKQYD